MKIFRAFFTFSWIRGRGLNLLFIVVFAETGHIHILTGLIWALKIQMILNPPTFHVVCTYKNTVYIRLKLKIFVSQQKSLFVVFWYFISNVFVLFNMFIIQNNLFVIIIVNNYILNIHFLSKILINTIKSKFYLEIFSSWNLDEDQHSLNFIRH